MSHRKRRTRQGRIIFVTGTDTGAGKTVLTGLLLAHLRRRDVHALAMKPFSTGDREDAKLLRELANRELTLEEMNPFHFRRPLAPLMSASLERKRVHLEEVLARIRETSERCEMLLIEGAGGLLTPLGAGFSLCDLVQSLRGEVLIAARNKLGVINHTLLTLHALQGFKAARPRVALMECETPDDSAATNLGVLRESDSTARVVSIPWLAGDLGSAAVLLTHVKQTARRLANLLS